ncbi:MAG: hypothetical protein GWN84_21795 [Gammaproteobacteria bacterium]|nr:hypothetical protein [Gammaproteobacteria bacterium]NIU06414.1 hypothetical protein [Gammaproteobacteria bacterium]NIX87687.1 hypothetical protein [Gammaproteobacteria bacterium]
MTFYRVDHIRQAVPELEPRLALLEGLFGFRRMRSREDSDEGCRGVRLDVPGSWGQRWEVRAPSGADSPMQAFLDGPRGPGIHHVAVEVPDMNAAIEAMERLGIGSARRASGPSHRFIDIPFVPTTQERGAAAAGRRAYGRRGVRRRRSHAGEGGHASAASRAAAQTTRSVHAVTFVSRDTIASSPSNDSLEIFPEFPNSRA